jgi:hypothetical protein
MWHELGRSGMYIGYRRENKNERDHLEDQDVGGWNSEREREREREWWRSMD